MLWENLRSEEFYDAVETCRGVCAIPIGCVEAHGVHLPLGCDTIKGREFSIRAAEKEPVCIFPAMYFGEKSGHGQYPGTIIMPSELILKILEHSCMEIARNGFKKIVIVSSHGGNTDLLNAFTRMFLQKKLDCMVFHYYQKMATPKDVLEDLSDFPYLTQEDIAILQDYVDCGKKDGHGGFVETGCLYDICPELIRLDRIDALDGTSSHVFDGFEAHGIHTPFNWDGNYPNSLEADIHYGMNERIARALAQKTVERTQKAFKFLREETASLEFHKQWYEKQFKAPQQWFEN